MNWYGLVFVLIGGFAVTAAAMDWDWFMTHRKAMLFVKIFGRNGTRVFYILLGAALIALGGAGMTGLIDLSQK